MDMTSGAPSATGQQENISGEKMEKEALLNILKSFSGTPALVSVPVQTRQYKLRYFRKCLQRAREDIYAALKVDLHRDPMETVLAELIPLVSITDFLARNLPRLSRPRNLPGSLMTWPAAAKLYKEPYGRVLVVSTWNYPLLLALEPMLGAFAAGNQVVLKLSPRSPHTNEVVVKLIRSVFSPDEVIVIRDELSLEETIDARYDYIFVTGNTSTGQMVMSKAAAALTPCTMELGGKNPCIVMNDANLKIAARRIIWGKFFNAGQSCAAPDYLLVQKGIKERFMNMLAGEIRRIYGNEPLSSGLLASMPDEETYERIVRLSADGRLVAGGDRDPVNLTFAPTVIDRLPENSPLFTEEVFGPLLPVQEFTVEEEVIDHLVKRERPLAAYCFGGSKKLRHFMTNRYSCGAVVFDDVLLHFTNMHIPFGGVGRSGFGAYHGEKSFTTFTHEKPVMKQTTLFDLPNRYPPHSGFVRKLLEILYRL